MSIETERRCILSEWRVVLVSQTSFPIMYKIDRPKKTKENPRWFAEGYAAVRVPIGSRILTKWQEQVRPIDENDPHHQWYVVREWSEAEM